MLLSINSVLNGKYRIVRELGRGAMGVVYQAEHLLLTSSVAVKMLAPEFVGNEQLRERFFKEARTQSTLRHPSVNRVVDYFEQDRHLFLVLEFVEGESLMTLLATGPLPPSRCVRLITSILEGLDYVHRQGVVHRDVKPSNVLVDHAGRAVLIDFGIAVRAGGTRLTRAGGPTQARSNASTRACGQARRNTPPDSTSFEPIREPASHSCSPSDAARVRRTTPGACRPSSSRSRRPRRRHGN